MAISEKKMQIVIDNYFKSECDINTTIKNAFEKGFHIGVKKALSTRQWIPCSERLPEDGRQVLVYARGVHFALAKYDEMMEADGTYKKRWVLFNAWSPCYRIKDVIAWMPLPDVWKGE